MRKWVIALIAFGSLAAAALTIHQSASRDVAIASAPVISSSPEKLYTADPIEAAVPVAPRIELPVFDDVQVSRKTHRHFQLARGEDAIVVRSGDLINFHIRGTLQDGWFTYPIKQQAKWANVNRITLEDTGIAWIAGEIITTPQPTLDKNATEMLGQDTYINAEPVVYNTPVRISPDAAAGKTVLHLEMHSIATCAYM